MLFQIPGGVVFLARNLSASCRLRVVIASDLALSCWLVVSVMAVVVGTDSSDSRALGRVALTMPVGEAEPCAGDSTGIPERLGSGHDVRLQ